MIRDLSGIDPREGRGSEVDALSVMCQEGLVIMLLGMLRAIPPITKPSAGAAAAPVGMASSAYPSDVPYQGYRSDIVAGETTAWLRLFHLFAEDQQSGECISPSSFTRFTLSVQ